MPGIDSNTVLMLHLNGTDGSTTFTDDSDSGHVPVAFRDAELDTAQKQFGTASLLGDGVQDSLEIPSSSDWVFGTANWTIDFWLRFNSTSGFHAPWSYTQDGNNRLYSEYDSGDNSWFFRLQVGGSSIISHKWYFTPSAGTWYHVAYVRNGNDLNLYIGGSQIGSTKTITGINFPDFSSGDGNFRVGAKDNGAQAVNGWLDEFRVSKGVARWTTGFTPPIEEYTGAVAVNNDFEYDYHIGIGSINNDFEYDYHLGIGTVNRDLEIKYNLENFIFNDLQCIYDIGIGTVNRDLECPYSILSIINKDIEFQYHIGIGSINNDFEYDYHIFKDVNRDLESLYEIKGPVTIDYTFLYNLGIGIVNRDFEYPYSISFVNTDFKFVYEIIGPVISDVTFPYNLGLGTINRDLNLKYNLSNYVNQDFQYKYHIGIGVVNQDFQYDYDIAYIQVDSEFIYKTLLRSSNPTHMQHNFKNTVLRLHFNENLYDGTPNEVKDTSGFLNHGYTTGNPVLASGKFSNAVRLTNSSSIVIPHINSYNLTSAFTILFWINPEQYDLSIISKGSNYDISVTSNGYVKFGNPSMGYVTGTKSLNLNDWNFVTCVFTYNQLKSFIDSEIDNTISVTKSLPTNTNNLTIGNNGNYSLDELHILNQRLKYHAQVDQYLKQPTSTELIRVS